MQALGFSFSLNPCVYFPVCSLAPKAKHLGFSNSLCDLAALCNLIVAEILILLHLCTQMSFKSTNSLFCPVRMQICMTGKRKKNL